MMDDIDRSTLWWQGALKGVRGPIDADNPMTGKYRWVWKDKKTGGTTMGVVAYWYDSHDNSLRCQVDGRDIDDLRARERWPHDSRRPISDEVFYAFRDQGVWIDVDVAAQTAPEVTPETAPNLAIALEISAAKESAAKYAKVESDEEMALAQSLRARLQELAGKADKIRVEEKEPHLEAGREVDAKWQPIIKVAKATADSIRKAMQDFNDWKLAQAEKEKSNAPPPSVQVSGGGGRAAHVGVKDVVTAIDLDLAFKQFHDEPELRVLLTMMAQKAVDAGVSVPGATIEKRSNIR